MRRATILPIFNTPIEASLRVLVLLVEVYPEMLDLQRLSYFDHLLVHSADVGGPASLHPPTPNRAEELLIRRQLIEESLYLLLSRGLAERRCDPNGIVYGATDAAGGFISSLRSSYSLSLRKYARWVNERFGLESSDNLQRFFTEHIDRWGGEFAMSELSMDQETL